MIKVTFKNSRGEQVVIGENPYRLYKIEGLGDVSSDVQRQKAPFQDGATFIDSVLEERFIDMEIKILGNDSSDISQKRELLSSIFNPKLGEGVLILENDRFKREISAVPEYVPKFPGGVENQTSTFQIAIIGLVCPNPYWKSTEITEEPTFEPLFQFPFEGVFEIGLQRDSRIIVNDGDAPAPIYVEFHGPATNPVITNKTTGEFIKVNQTLVENEVMKIDTTPGKKSVYFVQPDGTERNVFNWIDLESTFFQLVVGENEIEYSADSDIQGAIVNIRYNKLYNAV